jgi:hypothetical protein
MSRLPDHRRFHGGGADRRGVVQGDGTFMLDGLLERECLGIEGLPEGWRLDSIDHGGRRYMKEPLELTRGDILSGVVIRVVPDEPTGTPPDLRDRGVCTFR